MPLSLRFIQWAKRPLPAAFKRTRIRCSPLAHVISAAAWLHCALPATHAVSLSACRFCVPSCLLTLPILPAFDVTKLRLSRFPLSSVRVDMTVHRRGSEHRSHDQPVRGCAIGAFLRRESSPCSLRVSLPFAPGASLVLAPSPCIWLALGCSFAVARPRSSHSHSAKRARFV